MTRQLATAALLISLAQVPAAHATPPELRGAWSRATPPGLALAAAYVEIDNRGGRADRLLAVQSPRAARVSVHRSEVIEGIAQMRPVATLHVGAGERLLMAPGGLHLMLEGLQSPLREGERVLLLLRFEVQGERRIEVQVRGASDEGSLHGHH